MTGSYTPEFYDEIGDESLEAARRIVPLIQKMFAAKTVVDFGCGTGAWLKAFQENGAKEVFGLDFGAVAPEQLQIPSESFQTMDLSGYVRLDRRFDLAISLEVAEHVSEEYAADFVGNLVRHADIVVFSAAIPGQIGTEHINCQYPSFWAEHFSAHLYLCFDPLRPLIWDMPDIPVWYRQNTLVFVSRKVSEAYAESCGPVARWIDLVHPEMLADTCGHLRTRINTLHCLYKQRIKDAKSEVWSKALTQTKPDGKQS